MSILTEHIRENDYYLTTDLLIELLDKDNEVLNDYIIKHLVKNKDDRVVMVLKKKHDYETVLINALLEYGFPQYFIINKIRR